jgi:hypothetical protein
MKLVFVILVVLGLLYGLSLLLANKTEPKDPKAYFDSVRSSLGDGMNSLSDRFGPGFDFKTVNDTHANAKTRTITVLHGQTVNIRIAGGDVQRLKFVQVQPACMIVYDDNDKSINQKTHKRKFEPQKEDTEGSTEDDDHDPRLKNTMASSKLGGNLEITCKSTTQNCVLKVK